MVPGWRGNGDMWAAPYLHHPHLIPLSLSTRTLSFLRTNHPNPSPSPYPSRTPALQRKSNWSTQRHVTFRPEVTADKRGPPPVSPDRRPPEQLWPSQAASRLHKHFPSSITITPAHLRVVRVTNSAA
ncbi:hypothetical protein E2C01_045447 [Portunus trituberculatus]|uniref:Uncharacterized protein n=1 Tax=Portunus trituberculatus TaxID=210409 RepID=A0A5B7G384_PORTR|nr:hypothetical protein [Portunus trituberculatus]